MSQQTILAEISAERTYQDGIWGGAANDDANNEESDWLRYIAEYAKPDNNHPFRERMLKVAALAVAAIESIDRKQRNAAPLPTPPTRETQASISAWAEATFGPVGSNARVAARANEEMAELLRALTIDDTNFVAAIEEAADVFIVLYRLAERLGVDIHAVIDAKMKVNRARTWVKDGLGCGKHVRQA